MVCPQDKLGGRILSLSQQTRLSRLMSLTSAVDIPCLQNAFLWWGTYRSNIIYERIDRTIAHTSFYNEFHNISIINGNFTVSNHAPILFDMNDNDSLNRPPNFRFQNFWTLDRESHRLIGKIWKCSITSSCFYRIQQKLYHAKSALKV